ncbi:Glucose-methanol-choline (GMC) oxidoreductase:NAD binding site [Prochlorococcus marinus str. MIT 9302]|uniref:Glucose-methanol-choline (GMC) oxidoreductase:NAD binding site n=1 Tax=Prochlorococcus marinus str. MIT 9302 TaxID=74545 RepID=A0A0A2A7R7_PROMR|nr:GMC family oxidoreductase [Prochlorococcus marinus]KGF97595.1 Glucose-methanol-choline (GMC) oxidoreductase:NAD binding site [Prochlorococcus marinus str. MIT 9302]
MDINPYDAIVVGSGATGGIAALTLAEQGIKVLVIEAGPKIKRLEASNYEPESTLKRLSGVLTKKHIKQSQHPGYWKNNPDLYSNESKHPYDFPKKKPFLWTQGNQYGGRSLTWGGITLRFSSGDFHPAKKDGFGPNWPISYDELSPHYDFIENFCGIYGRKDNIKELPNGKYIGEIPLTENENIFGRKIKSKLNYPFIQSRGFDRNSSVKEEKWPKSSSLGSTFKKALETGNVQIISNHLVESFEINKITELASKLTIVNLENGSKEVLNCDLILLCASTISTLRILLNSEYKSNTSGFKDNSGKLGKYLMDHISVCRFFSIPKTKNSEELSHNYPVLSGAGSFFIPFGTNLPTIDNINFHRGYGIWGAIDRLGIPKFLQKDQNTSIGFLIAHGEVLPRKSNSVSLSKKTDEWGIPIPHIEFEWSENELNMSKHMVKTIQKAIEAADGEIKNIDELINIPFGSLFTKNLIALSDSPPPPGYYIHEVGGAPMGINEENSVVDKFNRLWRCKNVLVLDGSCWPTSSWQSPTLTMMALSRRACLNIKKT